MAGVIRYEEVKWAEPSDDYRSSSPAFNRYQKTVGHEVIDPVGRRMRWRRIRLLFTREQHRRMMDWFLTVSWTIHVDAHLSLFGYHLGGLDHITFFLSLFSFVHDFFLQVNETHSWANVNRTRWDQKKDMKLDLMVLYHFSSAFSSSWAFFRSHGNRRRLCSRAETMTAAPHNGKRQDQKEVATASGLFTCRQQQH